MSAQFDKLLPLLVNGGVAFILIGDAAGMVHGTTRLTYFVEVVYERSGANLTKLSTSLQAACPYLRGAPPGLPFVLDALTLRNGPNFTLITNLGDLDLLGEVVGGGSYHALLPHAFVAEGFGVEFLCVDLPTLIKLKRCAGRPKDLEVLAELQALQEENES